MTYDCFSGVAKAPADPILGMSEAFNADKDTRKVNLGVGAYRDENGKPMVLNCVRKAEEMLLAEKVNHEYLPIGGVEQMCQLSAKLVFGEDSDLLKEEKVASVQTISGTGAIMIAARFLAKFYRVGEGIYPNILVSDPTWSNHLQIFEESELQVQKYRYLKNGCEFDEANMLADLKKAPERSLVLLHACAHNPTGVDPSAEQWQKICDVMIQKQHFPFFDTAYQGFATGDINKDAFAIRLFASRGMPMVVCQSYAKNMGLYGERAGCLHVVASSKAQRDLLMSQVKRVIRYHYSSPPAYGARLVAKVLSTPELLTQWKEECLGMSQRIQRMRALLVAKLADKGSKRDWSHVTKQIGMFSYTGLTPEQCDRMINEHHIYLTRNGRISLAGLNEKNVDYVAEALHAVTA